MRSCKVTPFYCVVSTQMGMQALGILRPQPREKGMQGRAYVKGMEKHATDLPARPQIADRTRKQATRTDTHSRPAVTHPRISDAVPMVCRKRLRSGGNTCCRHRVICKGLECLEPHCMSGSTCPLHVWKPSRHGPLNGLMKMSAICCIDAKRYEIPTSKQAQVVRSCSIHMQTANQQQDGSDAAAAKAALQAGTEVRG